jgi:hypothetical protein
MLFDGKWKKSSETYLTKILELEQPKDKAVDKSTKR